MKADNGLTAQEFGVILVAHLDALCNQLAGLEPIMMQVFGDDTARFASKHATAMSKVLEGWLMTSEQTFGKPTGQQQAEAVVCFMEAMNRNVR